MVAEQRCAPPLHHNTTSIPHPLNTNITLEPYPTSFKIPQLETYDGTKDPNDHLHAFYFCVPAQNASDALMSRIIHMIMGGLEARGLSSKQRKLYVREVKHQNRVQKRKFDDTNWKNQPITFTPVDFDTVVTPHNNPLVTFVMINNCEFPTLMGVATLRGNQEVARHCYITSVTKPQKGKDQTSKTISKEVHDNRQVMGVEVLDNRLEDETRAALVGDVEEVIKEEVEKLLQAGFIRRVDYCEWVANPVLVKKANGQWQMCIDCTNFNQTCPKDCYLMWNINKLVEAASGNERLSLLDAYSGYHQVSMAYEDEEKTSFYAEMVTIIFRAQIGRNLEVYVDDIMVKSLKVEDHLADLDETFNNLRKNRMRGIEVNLEKIKAVAEMESSRLVKDVQRLTGRVTAFHRFISKSADKCLPLFKIMTSATQKDESSKQKKFEWNPECQAKFDELKSYLNSPHLLTKVIDGEILYLYLGISDEAISFVLVREEGKQQKLVYYTSSVLHGAEIRYFIVEKAALAVVTWARKLRPYFQSHPIIVLTDQTLRQILQKPECSKRLIKWAMELREFEITFQKRSAIQAQALADFIMECTLDHSNSNLEPDSWILYVDGASSSKGSETGAILIGPDGYQREHAFKFNFDATNNMTEYEALLLGLQLALELKVTTIQVYSDSQLVVNQVNSVCEVVDSAMMKYVALVAELRCLNLYEAEYALREVHEGVCGSHVGARTLAHKVLRQEYYWSNMYKNATHFVQRDFCFSYGIKLQFTSVYHPKSNGIVESVNKTILEGIKPRLEQHKTMCETHFGKLASNWKGPYIVAEVPHSDAYILQEAKGKRVPRVWNVNNLKKFYP
ncbi:hypothetical protein SLEP1_g46995 [Rubroshorea leprosula]|uniref:RNase H type-1 domain-containing protein n=1 Tax=Rubroshorea leprosula TaxID=152421 RepID=A0AAV5LRL4_9ROSI|nr:hypothetical protein SLEP1_g46995 [Rubroshorea leprosula]